MKYLQIRLILVILIMLSAGIFAWSYFLPEKLAEKPVSSKAVLTETRTAVVLSPVPTPTPSPSPSPTPSPSVRPSPNKQSYVIAAYGDSMVDTMGENLDYLDKSMRARYPTTKFKFYNYGVGSQNIIEGEKRFDQQFSYKTRNYPAIGQLSPDIIIISSFAYNPLSPFDIKAYLSGLSGLIKKAKATNSKVYLLVEVAPIKEGFGKGVGGVNWGEEQTETQVRNILEQLNEAVKLSKTLNIPLIDVFTKSKVDGKYGNKIYIGTHDGIHPSIEGEIFMAEIIADTIKLL